MTRRTRNEDQEERRLRERKETKYRKDSESDSGEERKKVEAERKRNSRKRKTTANTPQDSTLSDLTADTAHSNSRNFRTTTEAQMSPAEQAQPRPNRREETSNVETEQGTSRQWNEERRNSDERLLAELNMIQQSEGEQIAGPSNSISERRREQKRLAQQRYRTKKREEELNRIREQKRQEQITLRQRLSQEQLDQIRDQDRLAHSEQRQRLTQEQLNHIRNQDRLAHTEQRQSQTPQRRAAVNATRRNNRRRQLRLGREYQEDPPEHNCGELSVQCSHCGAVYFEGEQHQSPDGTFNPCCRNGKVSLPLFPMYPEELRNLFTSDSPASRRFFEHIRNYNTALSFASMECQMDRIAGRGPYVFKVHGEIRHFTSPAIPANGRTPSYGQLFFVDESVAIDARMSNRANQQCDSQIMRELTRIINANHQFAHRFQMLRDTYREEETTARQNGRPMHDVRLVFHSTSTPDPRRYNAPRVPEVAVVYVGPNGEVPNPYDYVIKAIGGSFTKIPVVNRVSHVLKF